MKKLVTVCVVVLMAVYVALPTATRAFGDDGGMIQASGAGEAVQAAVASVHGEKGAGHPELGSVLPLADRVLDGFGERMRAINLNFVPTAILSRQVGAIRKQALIINLPSQPKAIRETLDGIFAVVPHCMEMIGGPIVETREDVVKAFRPAQHA